MAAITKVSPLAPEAFPDLPTVPGVCFATAAAGVKYQGRDDVMLALLAPDTVVAGTFTRSSTRAAPVLDCQAKLEASSQSGPAAILVNSGNANAFTGKHGQESVSTICEAVSEVTGVATGRIFTSSTGVIGEPLPHDRVVNVLSDLNGALAPAAIEPAARAIMTTDTYPKGASQQVDISGKTVTVSGIAKGSGMIAPDMATMLVYIFTDAKVGFETLQRMTSDICDDTFNCITVDSDTSTSDTLLVAATGASGADIEQNADDADRFRTALHIVMRDLAHQVVRDGEGATKFVTVEVTGAQDAADAQKVARAIANSPLVKTAIAGEDPNWGRVVMAVGKSGATADRDRLSIRFGDILVAEAGWVAPSYREEDGAAYMQNEAIVLSVDLGLGDATATVWTCDLTHDYISINADYRS